MIKKNDYYLPSEETKKRAWLSDASIYELAKKDPIKFWEERAGELFWFKKWEKGFEFEPRNFKWYVGGKINITANIFDHDFENRKNKLAMIWKPELPQEKKRTLTYGELLKAVNKLANALKKMGVKKGDRVGIYMPMIPEVDMAMLACARIGAVHAVVFSAFSAASLQVRLQDNEAKVLITADGYYRRGEVVNLKVSADAGIADTKVEKVIVVKRAGNEIPWQAGRDLWYHDLVKDESEECAPEEMDAEDLMFILYTSGSTGKPKGCVHTCGGYAVNAFWSGKWIFDFHPGDIFWCTADVGWVTGHTYGVYSPLLNGVTKVTFEGMFDWPQPDRWAEVIEEEKVTIFYTAPTAIRMLRKYGDEWTQKHELPTLRILGSVGEPIDEAAWEWYAKQIGKGRCPVVDTWWQTETGGILISSLPGIGPFKPAFTGVALPGFNFQVVDDQGKLCDVGKEGNLVLQKPFAPSLLRGIYKNPEKYRATYWALYGDETYFTSDKAYFDKNGLLRVVGRADDAIKVAGHRMTTGELEAAANQYKNVVECAAIGIPDEIKGQVPVLFVVTKGEVNNPAEVAEGVTQQLRKEIGPIAKPQAVYLVEALPKTRSGKIMRRILRNIFTGEDSGDLSTLANPESVEKIKKVVGK